MPKLDPRGFTLIELMIAIVIVGIAFAVVINSAASLKRNARDTQRKSELYSIQSALERCYADQGYYPLTITPNQPLVCGSNTYLNNIPYDPSTSDPSSPIAYFYQPLKADQSLCTSSDPVKSCVLYCLGANLENPGSTQTYSYCSQGNFQLVKP